MKLCGNGEIDSQHRILLDVLTDAKQWLSDHCSGNCTNCGESHVLLTKVMGLVETITQHFAEEERVMIHCGFPGYEAHKSEHDGFIQTTANLVERMTDGKATPADLLNFIDLWIASHLLREVEAFSKYKI